MLDKPKHKKQFFRQMKDDITKIDDVTYYVKGSEKEPYMIFNSINSGWLCDCKAFTFNDTEPCKHILMVKSSIATI